MSVQHSISSEINKFILCDPTQAIHQAELISKDTPKWKFHNGEQSHDLTQASGLWLFWFCQPEPVLNQELQKSLCLSQYSQVELIKLAWYKVL